MADLLPEGKQSFTNSVGEPLVGGKLYTYAAGTSTPKTTYSDSAGTTPNTNPIILNSRGECQVFWDGAYKVSLYDANDVLQYTVDNVQAPASPSQSLRNDLDSNTDAAKGAGLIGFGQELNYPANSAGSKLKMFTTPEDFGAVGDGATNDTAAMQDWLDYLAANGGVGIFPRKSYLITTGLALTSPVYGFAIYGAGHDAVLKLRSTVAATAISIVGPHDVLFSNFQIDCGHTITGFASHGISMRNADRVTCRDMLIYDYRNSAILTFVDTADTYGDCHIINCLADSQGNGQNGFLHEGMLRSSIQNCTVRELDLTGSPCYGLQLKNECKHSWIDGGMAEGCSAGVSFGGDGVGIGAGPHNCWVRGVIVKDCLDGVIVSKTTDCVFDVYADMTNSPAPGALTGYALNIGGSNVSTFARAVVKGVQSGRTSVLVRSDDVTVHLPYVDGYGSKILEMSAGVDRCRLFVDDIVGSVSDILALITDSSGTSTNEVFYRRDLATQGLNGLSTVFFRGSGADVDSYISLLHSSDSWTVRSGGVDRLFIQPTTHNPGTDNAVDSGAAARRWANIRAGNGTIITSDAREKQQIEPIPEEWLDAWADVQWVRYKWNDAVALKGDDARWHVGLIAQRVEEAFRARGIDAFRIGVLCFDEWGDDPDRGQVAGNRYGVRYDQAFVLEGANLRREINRLKAGAH